MVMHTATERSRSTDYLQTEIRRSRESMAKARRKRLADIDRLVKLPKRSIAQNKALAILRKAHTVQEEADTEQLRVMQSILKRRGAGAS